MIRSRSRRRIYAVLAITLVASSVLSATYFRGYDELVFGLVRDFRSMGLTGAVFYIVLQIVISGTGILPASLLGVAAGVTYGWLWGSIFAVTGTMLGAIFGFFVGKKGRVILDFLPAWLARKLLVVDDFMSADGWKSVFLIRLSPVMPFAAVSIALGASKISFLNYLIGTTASLPALLGYVFAGSLIGQDTSMNSSRTHSVFLWALAIGIIALVVALMRFVSYVQNRNRAEKAT